MMRKGIRFGICYLVLIVGILVLLFGFQFDLLEEEKVFDGYKIDEEKIDNGTYNGSISLNYKTYVKMGGKFVAFFIADMLVIVFCGVNVASYLERDKPFWRWD